MSNTFSTKQGILCSIETWHVRNFYQMSRCFALIIVTCNIFLLSNLWEMEYIHLNLFLWRPQITVLTVWLWVMALCFVILLKFINQLLSSHLFHFIFCQYANKCNFVYSCVTLHDYRPFRKILCCPVRFT